MHFKASLYLQLIKSDVKNWRLSNHLRVACNKYDDVLLTICRQFVFVFHKLSKNISNYPIAAMLFLYSNSGFTWLVEFTKLKDLNSTDAAKSSTPLEILQNRILPGIISMALSVRSFGLWQRRASQTTEAIRKCSQQQSCFEGFVWLEKSGGDWSSSGQYEEQRCDGKLTHWKCND